MNREEAIGHLRNMKMPHDKFYEETDETNKTLIDKGNEALGMATKALEQTRWIPVSERLPDREKYSRGQIWKRSVLVTAYFSWDKEKDAFISYELAEDVIDNNFVDKVVTAWMPPPQPYKAESEDEE